MQGRAGIGKDLPPYTIATEVNRMCGLNVIGLRRAGITPADRLALKQLYRLLFCSELSPTAAAEKASELHLSPVCQVLVEFIRGSKRFWF